MSKHQNEYDFTLLLDGINQITPEVENALYKAGCDDATISIRYGRMYLTFTRAANSFRNAVISAIKDVRKSKIGATVLRVDQCDLVTQAEIARRIGRSRQLVHQYMTAERGPGGFPAPACNITDGVPLWYWCEVAQWLFEHALIREDLIHEARELAIINNVLELEHQQQVSPKLTRQIMKALSLF